MLDAIELFLIISLFLYLLVCAIGYMLYQVYKQKKFNQKVNVTDQAFSMRLHTHLQKIEKGESIPLEEIDTIKKALKKTVYQTIFNQTLLAFKESNPDTEALINYVQHYPEYLQQIIKKGDHNDMEQTYKIVLIGEYGYHTHQSLDYLYKSLKKPSIYIRLHTLEALKKLGDTPYFFKALQYLSQEAIYIYPKAIIEILDEFQGDTQTLNQLLITEFDTLDENLQICCIEHWKNTQDQTVIPHLFQWLKAKAYTLEVRLSLIKYFTQVQYEPCKDVLHQYMQTSDWALKAITAKALAAYPGEETIQVLLTSIKDKNWYVRNNSATSLIQFNQNEAIGKRILAQQDLYAEEAFFYALFQNQYITYDAYQQYQITYKVAELPLERRIS